MSNCPLIAGESQKDIWHVTHGGGWTFTPNFSSLALTVWDRQCLEESKQTITEWMNELISNSGDCRTTTATPGLLMTEVESSYAVDPFEGFLVVMKWHRYM